MTLHRQLIYSIAVIISVTTQGHIFHPLGLGSEKCGLNYNGYFQPQIHVEGDILYACTNQGLYSKDLSDEGSTWQLVGFEGIPLQDYARKGDSILVLRYNENESYLLLSNDGGQTYEDITPEMFCKAKQNVYLSLVQHPTDSNTLLASSWGNGGIFQSRDFGQTWESLFNDSPEYIGYHPLTPEIIYESGSNIYGQPEINISYDAGQTWQDCSPYYPGYNNWNDVFRVAFHPTNSNRWVVGGWGCVYISDDNGHTWNTQNIRIDGYKLASPLRLSLFDNKNNDIVYMAGFASGEIHVMCSMDGGTTWNVPHIERAESIPEIVTDLKQYGDKLLIYSESDVYMVSKADLIAQTTPVTFTSGQMATIILPEEPDASKGKYYRLDRVEGKEIIFEQELQPRAHVPYIIVPSEDFSIDPNTLDLQGCSPDTVSIEVRFEGQAESQSIYFIGSYVSEELEQQEGLNIEIIDTTPDCSFSSSGETGKGAFLIGALRAYLTWDDPIDHGGAKGRGDMEIVLRDYGTSIEEMKNEELRSFSSTKSMKNDVFDLSGRKIVNGTPRRQSRLGSKESKNLPQGIYIENGVKKVTKQ